MASGYAGERLGLSRWGDVKLVVQRNGADERLLNDVSQTLQATSSYGGDGRIAEDHLSAKPAADDGSVEWPA